MYLPLREKCRIRIQSPSGDFEISAIAAARFVFGRRLCLPPYSFLPCERLSLLQGVTDLLLEIYMDKLAIPPVEVDEFDRPLGPPPPDPWESRAGVGSALAHLAPLLSEDSCIKIFKFFIPQGQVKLDSSNVAGDSTKRGR